MYYYNYVIFVCKLISINYFLTQNIIDDNYNSKKCILTDKIGKGSDEIRVTRKGVEREDKMKD